MMPKDDENEMSMEEILASIRRYVSDDEPETNQSGVEYSSGHTAEVIRLTDVLDQKNTQKKSEFVPFAKVPEQPPVFSKSMMQEEPKVMATSSSNSSTSAYSEHPRQDVPTSFSPPIHEPVILPFQKGGFSHPSSSYSSAAPSQPNTQDIFSQSIQDFSDVITEKTMNSTGNAFSKLSEAFQMAKAEKQQYDAQKNHGASPIESFVIELAKPMVRQWIEEHLPSLVDRLVTQEIEKLTEEMRKKIF